MSRHTAGAAEAGDDPSSNPRTFSDLSAADQLRAVEILRPGFLLALERYRERKRLEAAAETTN